MNCLLYEYTLSPRTALIATFLSYLFVFLLSVQGCGRKGVMSTRAKSVIFYTYSCYIFWCKDLLYIKYKNMIGSTVYSQCST